MKPILNIITAGSRIENLYKMEYNIKTRIKDFDVRWYVVFDKFKLYNKIPSDINFYHAEIIDGPKADISGAIQKNRALELITEGWVYALDDDNKIHPDFNKTLSDAIYFFPNANGFVFSQMHHKGRNRIKIRVPKGNRMKSGKELWGDTDAHDTFPDIGPIDAACYVVNIETVKKSNAQYKPFVYESDRWFFKSIYNKGLIYIDKEATYYNALRYENHPEYPLSHNPKFLVKGKSNGPQINNYEIEEWKNYDVITYKNNYDVISYQSQIPKV